MILLDQKYSYNLVIKKNKLIIIFSLLAAYSAPAPPAYPAPASYDAPGIILFYKIINFIII